MNVNRLAFKFIVSKFSTLLYPQYLPQKCHYGDFIYQLGCAMMSRYMDVSVRVFLDEINI
jgi:hypothetical protein